MQSTVVAKDMLGERDALGAMLGAGGMGQGIGPRPRAPAHVVINMLGHPYAQGPALVARFTQAARAAASLSHQHIVAVFDGLRGRHARSGQESWKHNPRRPHQHRGFAGVQPARRQGRQLVAELVKDPDSKSGGRSTASARQWSAAASSAADRLARTCGPARVGGHRPSQPRHYEQSDS